MEKKTPRNSVFFSFLFCISLIFLTESARMLFCFVSYQAAKRPFMTLLSSPSLNLKMLVISRVPSHDLFFSSDGF